MDIGTTRIGSMIYPSDKRPAYRSQLDNHTSGYSADFLCWYADAISQFESHHAYKMSMITKDITYITYVMNLHAWRQANNKLIKKNLFERIKDVIWKYKKVP